MRIKIIDERLHEVSLKPKTMGSAGIDLYACIYGGTELEPGERKIIKSGMAVEIPLGWVGLIIPRSSTGVMGLNLSNTTGVIDSDYRGEIALPVVNNGSEEITIFAMDRIAQLVLVPHYDYTYMEVVDELSATERGTGGFGSTGR